MVRIGGINVRDNVQAWIGLTDIYGIGRTTAYQILADAKSDPVKKLKEFTETELDRVRDQVKKREDDIEGNLRRKRAMNIKSLKDIKCYRGYRHMRNLPVNGQRTKTNARTCKGPKRPVRN